MSYILSMNTIPPKERIIFVILLIFFIAPEFIFGVIQNQLYSLYTANFSQKYTVSLHIINNPPTNSWIFGVACFQLAAIILFFVLLISKRQKFNNRNLFWSGIFISGILMILTFVVCLLLYATLQITPNFP